MDQKVGGSSPSKRTETQEAFTTSWASSFLSYSSPAPPNRDRKKKILVPTFRYNILLIPMAALGLLNPMLAGLATTFSSVSVVASALRLKLQTR
jgi:hypothetical protein